MDEASVQVIYISVYVCFRCYAFVASELIFRKLFSDQRNFDIILAYSSTQLFAFLKFRECFCVISK